MIEFAESHAANGKGGPKEKREMKTPWNREHKLSAANLIVAVLALFTGAIVAVFAGDIRAWLLNRKNQLKAPTAVQPQNQTQNEKFEKSPANDPDLLGDRSAPESQSKVFRNPLLDEAEQALRNKLWEKAVASYKRYFLEETGDPDSHRDMSAACLEAVADQLEKGKTPSKALLSDGLLYSRLYLSYLAKQRGHANEIKRLELAVTRLQTLNDKNETR